MKKCRKNDFEKLYTAKKWVLQTTTYYKKSLIVRISKFQQGRDIYLTIHYNYINQAVKKENSMQ